MSCVFCWTCPGTERGTTRVLLGVMREGSTGTAASHRRNHKAWFPWALQRSRRKPCTWHPTPLALWICKVPSLSLESTWVSGKFRGWHRSHSVAKPGLKPTSREVQITTLKLSKGKQGHHRAFQLQLMMIRGKLPGARKEAVRTY